MPNNREWQRRSDEWVKFLERSARKKRARQLQRKQHLKDLREDYGRD